MYRKHMTTADLPPQAYGTFIPFTFPGVSGVRCAFGTRPAGNMVFTDPSSTEEVLNTRKAFLANCGLTAWAELHQVHGDVCVEATVGTDLGSEPSIDADGQYTNASGLGLVIKTADCQPIFLTDISGTAIAALHVGWRGNVINLPGTGVQEFCRAYGLLPSEILAVRGPSLGPGAAEFLNFGQEWGPEFLPWFNTQRQTMDLWMLTRHQLMEAGVPAAHIFSLDLCTKSLPELFFSFRRQEAERQISLVWKE